jgi:hypothetical protein
MDGSNQATPRKGPKILQERSKTMGKNEAFDGSRMRQAIGAARIAIGRPGAVAESVTVGDVLAAGAEDMNVTLTEAEALEGLRRARGVLSENVVEFPTIVPIQEDRSEILPTLAIGGSAVLIGAILLAGTVSVVLGLLWIHEKTGVAQLAIFGVLAGAVVRLIPRAPGGWAIVRAWWATLVRRARTLGERA